MIGERNLGIRTSQARSLGYKGGRPRPAERLGRSLVTQPSRLLFEIKFQLSESDPPPNPEPELHFGPSFKIALIGNTESFGTSSSYQPLLGLGPVVPNLRKCGNGDFRR